MLARNPNWTPDQVKGALMRTARRVPINPKAAGVGEITVPRAVSSRYAPNPNKGLERYLVSDSAGSNLPLFDAQTWVTAVHSTMSWNSMSWADQSWATMSWADQSWSDMSWADMSWADMSWADVSQEDAAEGDAANGTDGYVAPLDAATEVATDPDLAVPVDPPIPASCSATGSPS